MRLRVLLSLVVFAATAALAQPEANAQQARFVFEPHYTRGDHVERRRSYNQLAPLAVQATVKPGSTPKGSSMIGIDLAKLKRAAAPVRTPAPQPFVQARIAPASFNNSFGKPLPMTANPKLLSASPNTMARVKPRAVASLPKSTNRSQNGYPKLVKHATPRNVVASRSKIQSYDSGYTPGSTVPSTVGSGYRTQQNVGGKIIHK
ncbi:hypothetical protein BH11CYA1_BH11CYA1_45250 [soil metagenome]